MFKSQSAAKKPTMAGDSQPGGSTLIIKSIRVQNFRCIKDETLYCENVTALVGPNGSGKSSFLRALDRFYSPNAEYTEDDFYAKDTSQSILMTVTFTDLSEEERKLFHMYIEGEELTVEKEMTWPLARGSQKYYGTSLQNLDFQAFREAKGENLRKEYNALRAIDKYSSLPSYTNRLEAEKTLSEWEQSNPDQCERKRDGGQFFGFKEVGEAHLEHYTKFIIVPAVRDASGDVLERKGSVITEIMDLVVRSTLAQRKEIVEFAEQVNRRYDEIFDPAKITELQDLEKRLSGLLQTYAPDTGVKLDWKAGMEIDVPMPEADVKLVEDEYYSPVGYTGHGVQRAFILAMLQYLALVERPAAQEIGSEEAPSLKMPNLILGIEEPELYQHPDRQRHLSRVLSKLTEEGIPEVVRQIQVIYSTHSPLFINLEQFEKVRVFRKKKVNANFPKQTKIFFTTLDKVAEVFEKIDNKPRGSYSGETLRARLRALMNPWVNEGFFARLVVLVEGIKDRAAILGAALAMEHDLESKGISVIPCNSKTCLDRAIAIFTSFDIPVYAIWDSDYPKKEYSEVNRRLLRLFNQPEEDWPEKVSDKFACFKKTIMDTLRGEFGEFLDETLKTCCSNFGIDKSEYAIENPMVFYYIFQEGKTQGKSSVTMEKVISKIISQLAS
jgi:predicted ATP-dependent endonuclease of OLD family